MTTDADFRQAPLSERELQLIDTWWRAANYLSVGQIYLLDNPLLREPLAPAHIKPRLLGHWGTTPGLNFIYAHMNRATRARGISAIYVTGPGRPRGRGDRRDMRRLGHAREPAPAASQHRGHDERGDRDDQRSYACAFEASPATCGHGSLPPSGPTRRLCLRRRSRLPRAPPGPASARRADARSPAGCRQRSRRRPRRLRRRPRAVRPCL